jgi:hypothetical protein
VRADPVHPMPTFVDRGEPATTASRTPMLKTGSVDTHRPTNHYIMEEREYKIGFCQGLWYTRDAIAGPEFCRETVIVEEA